MSADILRVANCSGFYGDRLSAMREMLEGGEVDVITGDYLAELTMLILGRDQLKDPSLGYARTFVEQAEDCMALALERGVKIVVTGRVTDASVVVGPAIAHFGWARDSYDELAGAVVAGHVIECGAQ